MRRSVPPPVETALEAEAFWATGPGPDELRRKPLRSPRGNEVLVCTLYPRTSRGTEVNVFPVVTVSLLLGVALGYKRLSPVPARLGLVIAAGYLLIGFIQHQRAAAMAMALARERGHAVERQVVTPTIDDLLLWRAACEADGRFHADAVRVELGGALVLRGIYTGAPPGRPAVAGEFGAGRGRALLHAAHQHPVLLGIALNPEQAERLGNFSTQGTVGGLD